MLTELYTYIVIDSFDSNLRETLVANFETALSRAVADYTGSNQVRARGFSILSTHPIAEQTNAPIGSVVFVNQDQRVIGLLNQGWTEQQMYEALLWYVQNATDANIGNGGQNPFTDGNGSNPFGLGGIPNWLWLITAIVSGYQTTRTEGVARVAYGATTGFAIYKLIKQ